MRQQALNPFDRVNKWITEGRFEESAQGCWIWQGSKTPGGYGAIGMSARAAGGDSGERIYAVAHRWMYELHIGPVPEGLDLDHLCRTRACINPWHLEPVTRSVNLLRAAPRETCPKGHEYTPENTAMHKGYRRCRTCTQARRQREYALVRARRRNKRPREDAA